MKNYDYLIVGDGFAALFFAHQLIQNNKNFLLYSEKRRSASHVSAGIINPAVLKRFTTFWLAQEQINSLHDILSEIENYIGKNYWLNEPILRIFHDEAERNLWSKKSQDDHLKSFLSSEYKSIPFLKNVFGAGEVLQSGRLDVSNFFNDFLDFLSKNDYLKTERFIHNDLDLNKNAYQDIIFKNIVFAEGMFVRNNTYFSDIPLHPNKGHHLAVKLSKNINNQNTFKKKHFLFPINEDEYYYGGTYDRENIEDGIDEASKNTLISGLKEFYEYDFEVTKVNFGFRPTVKDRRPIIGRHPEFHHLYIFNGLGSRGILNASYFSKHLFELIEYNKPLPEEVDVRRFQKNP